MKDWLLPEVRTQKVPIYLKDGIELFIKREDEINTEVSGNKFRKLKYNLIEAERQGVKTLLTFGGAFSNHIAATAAAGSKFGFDTIGVIRGEEIYSKIDQNPTLSFAKSCGMNLIFVSRDEYRYKNSPDFIEKLKVKIGKEFYILPEGGTNALAVKGCEEIITKSDKEYDIITVAVGTGGTISGLINSAYSYQFVYGFPALKGEFLSEEIKKLTQKRNNWTLKHDYHLGGYAKITPLLIDFLNEFYQRTQIPLDPIYNGKMIFGIFDMINRGDFSPKTKILAIHTGGLQGIKGFNQLMDRKKKKLLHYE